jgi:hypothetical protein
MIRIVSFAIAMLAARTAAAESVPATLPHINIGGEGGGGSDFSAGGARFHAGASRAFGGGKVRPTIALGATLGVSTLTIREPRAFGGKLALTAVDFGPELQLGVRFVDGGWADTRIYAGAAVLLSDMEERIEVEQFDVHASHGVRLAIGINYSDALMRVAGRSTGAKDDGRWLAIILPGQLEFAVTNTAGVPQVGFTIGYGL